MAQRYFLLLSAVCTHMFISDLSACSIVGYVGSNPCKEYILEGLSRLEYRGYDSAGLALLESDRNELICSRAEGRLEQLKAKIASDTSDGYIGIGHTRWATHGAAVECNAHPHIDSNNTLGVVHNGIIDNYLSLKEQLAKKDIFRSETDTEVIAHLLRSKMDYWSSKAPEQKNNLLSAVVDASNELQGTYAFIACLKEIPNTLVAVCKGSPVCVGLGKDEIFAASDFLALSGKTDQVVFMPKDSIALLTKDKLELYDSKGNALPYTIETISIAPEAHQKSGHEHYMLKEIYEQRNGIHALLAHCRSLGDGIWKQLGMTAEQARKIKRVHLLGCGTSWHAARIAQFYFETVCNLPTTIFLASEFRYMPLFTEEGTLFIAVSQSGETADTLEAVRLLRKKNEHIIALTNVPTSSLVRETNGFLPLMAGPEIAVASTKAFSAQVSLLYWLAHRLALEKGTIGTAELQKAEEDLGKAANTLEEMIERHKVSIMQTHAKKYAAADKFIFLGRHIGYPFAMEAALKLKEISYIFAQGYPAGELKHGSIALIDVETPVMLFSHLDPELYKKLLANAQEVKARKGHLIAVAFEGQKELISLADEVFTISPVSPLLEPIAMAGFVQFFAYQVAKELGCDIDKPRNLAKAVTVE